MSEYSEKIDSIKELYNSFITEAEQGETGRSRKRHSLTARKLSMQLQKEVSSYRPLSIKNDKLTNVENSDS